MGWIKRCLAVPAAASFLLVAACQIEPEAVDHTRGPDYTQELGCAPSTLRLMDAAGPVESVRVGPHVAPELTRARPTVAFLDSVGVNIHMTYTDTPYDDHAKVLEALREMGIRHVRDRLVPGREGDQAGFLEQLGERGGCAQLVLGGETVSERELARSVDLVREHADVVAGVEGPNELDLLVRRDWQDVASSQQRFIAAAFRDEPGLEETPVAAPSVGRVEAFRQPGDLSENLDMANIHPYPGGDPPEGELDPHIEGARALAGDAPVLVTETGYHNALADEESQPGVTEDAAAAYLPRLLLDAFAKGVVRTYLYELVDEFPNDDDDQASFGLYKIDWSAKPSAESVSALLALLASTPSSQVGSLQVAVQAEDGADVRSLLLADDEGYWLALWQATSVYDYRDNETIDVEAEAVTVVLDEAADIEVHWLVGNKTRDVADAKEIGLPLTAEPLLMRIEPR